MDSLRNIAYTRSLGTGEHYKQLNNPRNYYVVRRDSATTILSSYYIDGAESQGNHPTLSPMLSLFLIAYL